MRKLKFLFLASFAVLLFSCSETMDPIDYNDTIVDLQTSIAKGFLSLPAIMQGGTIDQVNAEIDKMVITTDSAITELEKLGAYEKDDAMQQAALALFKFYRELLDVDYRRIVEFNYMMTDELTDDILNEMSEIEIRISSEETILDAAFQTAQENFATKYQIQIIENPLQEQIDN